MSRLPFELFLALRYLRPKRTFVSVITLISVVGVTLGVAVLIIVISVMTGFDRQLREKILGFNAHIRVFEFGSTLRDYSEIAHQISQNPHVKGVAPYVIGPVLVETHPEGGNPQVMAPYLRGIDPRLEGQVTTLTNSIIRGSFDVRGQGLLIGRELANGLGLSVGDRLDVFSVTHLKRVKQNAGKEGAEVIPPDEFTIKGIFDVGYYEYNAQWIVCSLANAQDLYDLEDSVHGLLVMLRDPFQSESVKLELMRKLGARYGVSTWQNENAGILDALVVEKNVMFYLLFFIMIVAAFGIASALITFVVQKTREIGMLKALGATSGQVLWLFLSQSVLVGVIGTITGFGLGMLALRYRNEFLAFMRKVTNFELFPESIYAFRELPALIVPGDIALICGSALLICLLAGLFPAWHAARLRPVEALRHE
jgi:lipoprotein-releasing system permease protein